MSDEDCTLDTVCDTGNNVCVACNVNEDCSEDTPFCSDNECVECLAHGDCRTPEKPLCGDNLRCAECKINGHCS